MTNELPPKNASQRCRNGRDSTAQGNALHVMQESDTYLMIVDEGKEKQAKHDVLLVGEERFGAADEAVTSQLERISDLDRLNRMIRRAVKARDWQEVLDTP